MHDYCKSNNIIFKEHCFIWGSQQPNWVNDSNGEAAVKNWMKNFCDRYGKPLIRLPGGYNSNQVAAQIMAQASERLK